LVVQGMDLGSTRSSAWTFSTGGEPDQSRGQVDDGARPIEKVHAEDRVDPESMPCTTNVDIQRAHMQVTDPNRLQATCIHTLNAAHAIHDLENLILSRNQTDRSKQIRFENAGFRTSVDQHRPQGQSCTA